MLLLALIGLAGPGSAPARTSSDPYCTGSYGGAKARAGPPMRYGVDPDLARPLLGVHILGDIASEWLNAEDLYYVGFHFAERFGKEREFGAAVLRQVVKGSPRSKVAAAAKNKLKSVAVD